MIPIPGHNLTLNHDSGSKFNVELIPRVIIQRESRPGVTIQQGVQILSVGGVVIQWPPVSGVAIQHEKSVESWAHPVESRPHGSKFNGVKIQSYTGNPNFVNTLPLYTINIQFMYENLNFSFLLWNKLHLNFVTFLLPVSIYEKDKRYRKFDITAQKALGERTTDNILQFVQCERNTSINQSKMLYMYIIT